MERSPWPTLIALARLSLLVIDKNNQGNSRRFRAFPDGVALWAPQSGPYQPCHNLRRHRNGYGARRDLMGWDAWWHQLHRLSTKLGHAAPTISTNSTEYASTTIPASQASVCPLTQLCSPSPPIPISPSQPRSTGTTPHRSPSNFWHHRSYQSLWFRPEWKLASRSRAIRQPPWVSKKSKFTNLKDLLFQSNLL